MEQQEPEYIFVSDDDSESPTFIISEDEEPIQTTHLVSQNPQLDQWFCDQNYDPVKLQRIGISLMFVNITESQRIHIWNEKGFIIHSFLLEMKRRILKIRRIIVLNNFLNGKSAKITDPKSILREKAKQISWTKRTKKNSKKIWIPTKTDSIVTDLKTSNITSKNKIMLDSWFSVRVIEPKDKNNLPLTYSPSSLTVNQHNTPIENTKIKSRKTKVYFSNEFKPVMKQLIGSYRYWYNQGINYLQTLPRGYYIPKKGERGSEKKFILYEGEFLRVEKDGEYAFGIIPKYDNKGKRLSQTGFQAIRNHLKTIQPGWFKNGRLPVHLIDQASREVADNYTNTIEARKKDRKPFRLRFKSKKKSVMETISMEASSVSLYKSKKQMEVSKTGYRIYRALFNNIDSIIYTKEPLHMDLKKEYTISYNRNTKEYFISTPIKATTIKVDNRKEFCSIDPGEVVPCALYDPEGNNVFLIGENHRTKFEDSAISKLTRKISHATGTLKKRLKKALQKTRERKRNLKTEFHHKLANFICSNFKRIIVPEYGIRNMKLGRNTNRGMRNIAFYDFVQFLKHKCSEHQIEIFIVQEHYTTVCCCSCGHKNKKPSGREYTCINCGMEIHRDANGAVNIFLKHVDNKVTCGGQVN